MKVDRGLRLGLQARVITSTEKKPSSSGAPAEPSKSSGVERVKRLKRRYTAEEYDYAMELLKQGKGLNEVSKLTGIPKSTLSYWKRNKHKPPLAKWRPKPCPELAYVIGVQLSDGYVYEKEKKWMYQNGLYAKDREYVEHYNYCMAVVLGRNKENRIRFEERPDKELKGWRVEYGSVAFYTWFEQQSLEALKPYIEHCEECIKAFLRGFFDGDGGSNVTLVYACNTNRQLLEYIKELLEKIGVRTGKISIAIKAGTEHWARNRGIIRAKKDCFQLNVNRKDFLEKVGFTIKRKNK